MFHNTRHLLASVFISFVFTRSPHFSANHVSVWIKMCASAAWLSSPRSCSFRMVHISSRSRCVITAHAAHGGSSCDDTGCTARPPLLAVWNYYTVSCKCPTSQLKAVYAEGLVPPDVYHGRLCMRSTLITVGWMCVGMCVCMCVCVCVCVCVGCLKYALYYYLYIHILYAYVLFFVRSSTQTPNQTYITDSITTATFCFIIIITTSITVHCTWQYINKVALLALFITCHPFIHLSACKPADFS